MRKKPDINAFLEGGAVETADRTATSQPTETTEPQSVKSVKVHREQKIFRLPLDLINRLKREAYERSMQSGTRITETELVEEALRKFFNE
ncbi:MAG: hypothetical protein ACXWFI_08925 [Methylobacter sp.]